MRKWKVAVGLSILCCCTVALAVDTGAVKKAKGPKIDSSQLTSVARLYTEETKVAGQADASQYATPQAGSNEGTVNQAGLTQSALVDGNVDAVLGTTCATATLIDATSTTQVTLTGSTADPTTFPCKSGGAGPGYGAQWYKFVATDQFVMIDTCGTNTCTNTADTLVGLWSGTCAALVNVACGDDECGEATGYLSQLQASGLTPGNTYYISVAKWSSTDPNCTYTMNVMSCQGPATITCGAGDYMEWEIDPGGQDPGYFPWYWGVFATNNGCTTDNLAAAGYTRITCGVTVCGSAKMQPSVNGIVFRDLDFYEFYVPATSTFPLTITWDVLASFAPNAWIIEPAAGVDPCDGYTTLDFQAATGGICEPHVLATAVVNAPGTYWVVVAPDFNQNTFATAAFYQATLNTSPSCEEPEGACCIAQPAASPVCSISTKDACVAPVGGSAHYWGDGTVCESVTCWECPGYPAAAEGTCVSTPPYTWTGENNNGCGNATTPVFTNMGTTNPFTTCGTAATYLDANPPTTNLRDNDWYRWGTNAAWPINTIKAVSATVLAEFPVEVSIATPGPDAQECTTDRWVIVATAYGQPGEQVTVETCVKSNTSTLALFGRVWVIVRPSLRGNPLDIPCGVRYSLNFAVSDDCSTPGACCKTTTTNIGGCVVTTAADCFATAGAVFYGQGTTCADANVCCPCLSTSTNEAETVCNFPDGVDSSCFYLTGGAQPTRRIAKAITPGTQTYCGASAWVYVASAGGYIPDYDCYYFAVTQTSDILFKVFDAALFDAFLLKEATGHGTNVCYTNPNNPSDPTAMKIWSWGLDNPKCVEWTGIAEGFDPGTYHACLRYSRDDELGAICVAGASTYHGPRYQVRVVLGIPGACCNAGACTLDYEPDCLAAGGTFMGTGTTCSPNPCCDIPACVGTPEGEPVCGDEYVDVTNGGCNSTPPVFGSITCNETICGETGNYLFAGNTYRDTDWYAYTHTGGTLTWTVTADFVPLIFVLDANCETITGWQNIGTANDCQVVEIALTDVEAPAGNYYLVVMPDFTLNPGLIPCGTPYTATLTCVNPVCPGDADCDGQVGFSDIDLFVSAIPDNEAAWAALYATLHGGNPPTCPFLNNDCTGDGHVLFNDIDPFVALIPSPCP